PALRRRQRPRFLDPHGVADVRVVGLVVGLELGGQADDALVQPVAREPFDGHDDRLVHPVAHHAPDLGLALALPRGGALGHGHRLCALSGARRGASRLALALDGEDAGDLAPRLGDAAGVIQLPRRERETRAPEVLLGLQEGIGKLLVGHLANLGDVAHRSPPSTAPSRVTTRVATGSLWLARRIASVASSCGTPAISNRIRPGLTTATQWSGAPLPEPMRGSAGLFVPGLSGKMRAPSLPAR